jgi:hypothetical protein
MNEIYVCGDIHGMWNNLNKFISTTNPNIIIQCGDFGWWPHYHNSVLFDGTGNSFDQYGIYTNNTKIYFCDGNHENHDDLESKVNHYGQIPIELMKNVFYMPRASILKLPDDRTILFIGGAESIDKNSRLLGVSWWPQETITQKDIYNLPDINIDIVISHTLPSCVMKTNEFKNIAGFIHNEPSNIALQTVFEQYNPPLWYCGHFHDTMTVKINNTVFKVLSHVEDDLNNWVEKI